MIRVGVVGYTEPKFDKVKAWELLKKGFDQIKFDNNTDKLVVISGLTDMGAIFDLGKEVNNQVFNKVIMSGFMTISEPETASTGSMAVVKNEKRNFDLVESYKIGFYPLPPQGLGTEGKILWMGAVRVKQPTAIAYRDTLTTSL